jgi:acylphosphatase
VRQRFVVHGLVQGVFFRTTAADEARRLGLTGRIWNRRDGSVECVAEGAAGAVERFREWLAHGPPRARVERLDVADEEAGRSYPDFRVAREG